jgi:hypothetical protein
MKPERFSRHLLTAFGLSVALYVFGYWFIESQRVADTPWLVSFTTNATGVVAVKVQQDSKSLGPVTIQLKEPNSKAPEGTASIRFDTPRAVPFPVPGGQCIFQDTTFLPGTVVLELGSKTVQMIPRVLTIGTNEYAWEAGKVIRADTVTPASPLP